MSTYDRDVGELLREFREKARGYARKYPWWPVALILAYACWWGFTKLDTQKFCLQAGYTASAVAWDGSGFCISENRVYGPHAIPVDKVQRARY